jgi:L-rhamnose mutarotase
MEKPIHKTKTFCFTLDLKDNPELIAQYERYHKPGGVWKEIIDGIREVGILKMEIYRASNRLVMLLETVEDFDVIRDFEKMGKLPRQAEWASVMSRFQQKLSFAKPGEHWVLMNKIFDLNAD